MVKLCVVLSILLVCLAQNGLHGQSRPLQIKDCVQVRRIEEGETRISPDGKQVAYVVKAPNVSTNKNRYELFVRDLTNGAERSNGRLLLESEQLSAIRWLAEGRGLMVLSKTSHGNEILTVDLNGHTLDSLSSPAGPIADYASDIQGMSVVFTAETVATDETTQKERAEKGFRVQFGESLDLNLVYSTPDFYVSRVEGAGRRRTEKIDSLRSLAEVRNLSMSPDGRYFTFIYLMAEPPAAWKSNDVFQRISGSEILSSHHTWVLGLYDFNKRTLQLGINSYAAGFWYPTVWSGDSKAFVVPAPAPVGSIWQKKDIEKGFHNWKDYADYYHLFSINLSDNSVSEVLSTAFSKWDPGTVSWSRSDGEMIVRTDAARFARMVRRGDEWQEVAHFSHSLKDVGPAQLTVSDGHVLIGVYETTSMPPDLFLYDFKNEATKILTDLNSEFRNITMGRIEDIQWTNKYGARSKGHLIKPVGYELGKKYPLVITGSNGGNLFVCDGYRATTAYPPQPLANAGFVVLMADNASAQEAPKNFPGRMGEAYNFMAMVEGAIDSLSAEGLIDRSNVGITGFSRTSWKTDFMLTHSDFRFAAASSADGGNYNYGSYWLFNSRDTMNDSEEQFGGPPYGKTFENYLKFAPAFNAQNVHTPVLMEYILNPAATYEFFAALSRQNKPVELYFYPKGSHPFDTPLERLSSLQRNVDWFRFWMQGYEGKAPSNDPDQYVRWRELRKLQEKNEAARNGPKQ